MMITHGYTQDAALMAFLRSKLNTFIKWDVVRFFHDNPYAEDTAHAIAQYIGREDAAIETDLQALLRDGVLHTRHVADVRLVQLAADDEIRRLINDFLNACDDREFRALAVHQVINAP